MVPPNGTQTRLVLGTTSPVVARGPCGPGFLFNVYVRRLAGFERGAQRESFSSE